MEVLAVITMIQSMISTTKVIAGLAKAAISHQEEVKDFADFIGEIENKLVEQETFLRNRQTGGGRQMLRYDVVASLEKLSKLLKKSKHLLRKLQKSSKVKRFLRMRNTSRRIKELREKINECRIALAEHMLYVDDGSSCCQCPCCQCVCCQCARCWPFW